MTVRIPRQPQQPAREARLELRWAKVPIKPPRVGCKNSWGTLQLWTLLAREINPPRGAQPIEWVLLSNWPIAALKMARRLVRWYGLRWGIECWHQALKDVCKVETRQMKSAESLGRALVLDMIVAWRVLLLCRLGQAHPTVSASLLYSPQELAVLEILKKTLTPEGSAPPADLPRLLTANHRAKTRSTLTLSEANLQVASLAGFWGRQGEGSPGPDVMGRGLLVLNAIVQWHRLTTHEGRAPPKGAPKRRKRQRPPTPR